MDDDIAIIGRWGFHDLSTASMPVQHGTGCISTFQSSSGSFNATNTLSAVHLDQFVLVWAAADLFSEFCRLGLFARAGGCHNNIDRFVCDGRFLSLNRLDRSAQISRDLETSVDIYGCDALAFDLCLWRLDLRDLLHWLPKQLQILTFLILPSLHKHWQIFIRVLSFPLIHLLGLTLDVDEELAGGLVVGIVLLVHHRSLFIAALLGNMEPRLLEIILRLTVLADLVYI